MSIANLLNVPTDQQERDDWTFTHMVHHRDVNEQIFILTGVRIDEYVLDPVDPQRSTGWEDQHQAMHAAVNAVLGISGLDLTGIEWDKPTILSGWIFSNFTEHRQWANQLGVA